MKSDEFIREVNEELQQDKLKALWNLYGPWVIAAAVVVIAGTASVVGWQSYQDSQLQAQGALRAEAIAALDRDDSEEAIAKFAELGAEFDGGSAALAAFGEAAALARSGDKEGAIERLAQLGSRSDADPALAALAKLRSIQMRIDDDDPAALMGELEPLAEPGKPFSLSAREALAIAAIRAGELARAEEALRSVIDDAFTSDGLQSRATELLFSIGGELSDDSDAVDAGDDEVSQ